MSLAFTISPTYYRIIPEDSNTPLREIKHNVFAVSLSENIHLRPLEIKTNIKLGYQVILPPGWKLRIEQPILSQQIPFYIIPMEFVGGPHELHISIQSLSTHDIYINNIQNIAILEISLVAAAQSCLYHVKDDNVWKGLTSYQVEPTPTPQSSPIPTIQRCTMSCCNHIEDKEEWQGFNEKVIQSKKPAKL
jgi:hypothetical protein